MSAPQTGNIQIVVNGEDRFVPYGTTVNELLCLSGLDPQRVAVELDRRIVKKAEWTTTPLPAGSQVEIVQFVGGG